MASQPPSFLTFQRNPKSYQVVMYDGSVDRAKDALALGNYTKVGCLFRPDGITLSVFDDKGQIHVVENGWYVVRDTDTGAMSTMPASDFLADNTEVIGG